MDDPLTEQTPRASRAPMIILGVVAGFFACLCLAGAMSIAYYAVLRTSPFQFPTEPLPQASPSATSDNPGVAAGWEAFYTPDYEAAVEAFTDVLADDPENVDALLGRGRAYQRLRRYDDAMMDFDEAIRLDPENARAYYGRGESYRKMEQYDEALEAYELAMALDPTYAEPYD